MLPQVISTLRHLALILLIVIFNANAFSQKIRNKSNTLKFSSNYTTLNKDCKKAFNDVSEGEDSPLKCEGYGQYYISIGYSAEFSHIEAVNINDSTRISLATVAPEDDKRDRKIEWRLANGKPFAVILRISNQENNVQPTNDSFQQKSYKKGEFLIVKGLKGYEQINLELKVKSIVKAYLKARKFADAAYLRITKPSTKYKQATMNSKRLLK